MLICVFYTNFNKMTYTTLSPDVRGYLKRIIEDSNINWDKDGFYRVTTKGEQALTLHRIDSEDNREFSQLYLDSNVRECKPFFIVGSCEYYWFIEEIRD